jgi:DNA-binding transcriptional regulator YhcF (GntR family)
MMVSQICRMSFVKNIVVRLYFLIYRFGVFLTSSSEGIFVDAKENKIEYTTIFEQYTNLIESFIEQKLKSEIPVSDRIMF